MSREVEPVPAEEVQRQFAIGQSRKRGRPLPAEFLAQLEVVVDLAVGDQCGAARLVDRLVAGRKIDDREPRLYHSDTA